MLFPTSNPIRPPVDSAGSRTYFLSDVSLEILSPNTAVFKSRLNGPAGSNVWARAWLSNETDGTLAEAASPRLNAGDPVTLTLVLRDGRVPENACLRIESAPLATEHLVIIQLPTAPTGPSSGGGSIDR
jgi:hypothetical protein